MIKLADILREGVYKTKATKRARGIMEVDDYYMGTPSGDTDAMNIAEDDIDLSDTPRFSKLGGYEGPFGGQNVITAQDLRDLDQAKDQDWPYETYYYGEVDGYEISYYPESDILLVHGFA